MEGNKFFLRQRGEVTGPFTRDQLLTQKNTGQISVVHSVSTDRQDWTLARDIPWLFPPPRPIEKTKPPDEKNEQEQANLPVVPPPPPKRRTSPALVFASAFLITLGVAAAVIFLIKNAGKRPPVAAVTPTHTLDIDRIDGHVCLVVQMRRQTVVRRDGSSTDVVFPEANGSGFVVSHDGYIITNRHVVADVDGNGVQIPLPPPGHVLHIFSIGSDDPDPVVELPTAMVYERTPSIKVRFNTDDWIDADVVYVAQDRDVSILKVKREFPSPFAVATHFQRGERVTACGFPGASQKFARTMNRESFEQHLQSADFDFSTTFHVNASDLYPSNQVVLNQTSGEITAVIDSTNLTSGGIIVQTNTYVRHGNSGGPLLNEQGEVVGIVTRAEQAHAQLAQDPNTKAISVRLDMDSEGLNSAFSLKEMSDMLAHKTNGQLSFNFGPPK